MHRLVGLKILKESQ